MDNRYVPLRPAPITNLGDVQSSSSGSDTKRRRVGVSVACEVCRKRKIRCDGNRPACSACQGRAEPCIYREVHLTKESAQHILEIIYLLNSMPKEEASRVLKFLKTEKDASIVLSVLRGGMDAKQRPSDATVAAAIMEESFLSLELEAQNPVAYPMLSPINIDVGGMRILHMLREQQTGNWPPSPREAGVSPTRSPTTLGRHKDAPILCDSRLHDLDIQCWTNVPIDNGLASSIISLYLQTDHPLLGHFDPDLFVSDLVNRRDDYCSSLLVNSLLYWACQMYTAIDHRADALANDFCDEAEELWRIERGQPSILNMAAAQFLSLAYLGQGKDHAVLSYLVDAGNMGVQIGLFGVENHAFHHRFGKMTAEARCAYSHAAWGVFNWTVLISLFYHQPGVECPRDPPELPLPGEGELHTQNRPSAPYMGEFLPHLCRFWSIVHEVGKVYYMSSRACEPTQELLRFAEFKFRELLAWSNGLPSSLSRDEHNSHPTLILHLWLHAAVLDIFRPFVGSQSPQIRRLRTFSSQASSPDAVYAASVNQLKRLIVVFRMNHKPSTYTILWHTALIYVANAVLRRTDEESWYFYFLLCVYGYEGLRRSWRVTEAITRGLLSMALRNGDISSETARHILKDVEENTKGPAASSPSEIRATFMVDLDLAWSDPGSATVEKLAENFEENVAFRDYTNIFDAVSPGGVI
ncbi:Nitrogen assimilation transcription factor nit-4-like protein [Cladobotryum mycophilum]|uniref:Nitrogen assimilation transcription factor nit-4-like protein n=1 Tax=Cladobotryum mycophilum TaxID=491253 RepID=A0ABR0SEJ2_9HYPO